jgi:hypothetical protein
MNSSELLRFKTANSMACTRLNIAVGPTGASLPALYSTTGPTGTTASVVINSTTGVFIQTVTVTTNSSTESVLILGGFEYFIGTSAYQMAATLCRGTGSPSTAFINLANGVAFSTTEIAIASGSALGQQDNLNTSLVTRYTSDASQGNSCSFSFVDTPGAAGTFTYAIRIVATASVNTLYLKQIYLNAIKVNP